MDSGHSEQEAGSPASRSPPPRSPAKKLYQCGEKPYQYNQASYALGGPLGTGTLPCGQFYHLESAKKILLEKNHINVERNLINTVPQMEPNKITIYSRTLVYSVNSIK